MLFERYMRNDWLAAVNIDDSYGRRLYGELGGRAVSYGTKDRSSDFFAVIKGTSAEGMDVEIRTPDSKTPVATRLPLGRVQHPNALQAFSAGRSEWGRRRRWRAC